MYGFNITFQDIFDNAVKRVTEALKSEDFGVLTDIDVQATMKARLGVKCPPYRILGTCSAAGAQGDYRRSRHRPAAAVQRDCARHTRARAGLTVLA